MHLPSFANLIAFDAAVRRGTLSRAAQELSVSQPAISRRIGALEADLGRPLFDRRTKPLTLTRDGKELFDVLRSGLRRLEEVIARLRGTKDTNVVTISAGAGVAAYWLIPRLPQMQAAFPKIMLRISSKSHHHDVNHVGDIQIRFGNGAWDGFQAAKMFAEEVFAVCSPLYAGRRSMSMPLNRLKKAHLLDMKVAAQSWYDWTTWFEAVRAPATESLKVQYFDSYALVVSAALAGQGVCLCWAGLLDMFLASGALIRINELNAASNRGYFVTHDVDLDLEAPVRAIAKWLVDHSGPAKTVREAPSAPAARGYRRSYRGA